MRLGFRRMDLARGRTRASTMRWELEGLRCMVGRLRRKRFARCMGEKAEARALTRSLPRGVLRMSARGFWGEICLGRCADRGEMNHGRDGGATRRRIMCRYLS